MTSGHGITPARFPDDLEAVRRLFEAYARALPIDLGYQDFAAELDGLPGKYAPPAGALLLARGGGGAMGSVALRAFGGDGTCEMKRLYVTPEGRGSGLGAALAAAIIAEARRLGYRRMTLDTLPSMTAALALYRRAGFTETAAYYATPIAETVFMARDL